jgi:polyhydroxyalkanoate synthesis regulator phasin
VQFNDGRSSMMIYGTGADTAAAAGSLTTEEARAFAEEIVRILTKAWRAVPG